MVISNLNRNRLVSLLCAVIWVFVISKGLPIAFTLVSEIFPEEIARGLIFPLGMFYFGASIFMLSWVVSSVIGE